MLGTSEVFSMKNISILVNDLTISWDKKCYLDKAKYAFCSATNNSFIPIMGESGSGKSTLLYVLSALKKPVSGYVKWQFPDGKIYINQKNKAYFCDKELKKNLYIKYFGITFQDSILLPQFTVDENLRFSLEHTGIKPGEAKKKVNEFINEIVDTDNHSNSYMLQRYPSQISVGERQRVALLQCILHDPYVIFADEPTSNLDPIKQKEILGLLKKWSEGQLINKNNQESRVLIWVTHRLSDILYMNKAENKIVYVENKKLQPFTIADLEQKGWHSKGLTWEIQ